MNRTTGPVGVLTHRPLDLGTDDAVPDRAGPSRDEGDLDLLTSWVTHPRSAYWMMQDATREEVRAAYADIIASPTHHAFLGSHDDTPAFLFELYDPASDPVGAHLRTAPGDLGMHVLVAPTEHPVHGFTRAVMRHVMAACFADPAVQRVVVEPDAGNERVRRLNLEVGFTEHHEIDLPDKRAMLSTCARTDHERSLR